MNHLSPLITDPSSALSYRICEPAPKSPSALLVLLHGVGGNETNLAELAVAAPANTLVVLARGRLTLAPGAYAWFRVAFGATGPQIVAEEAEHSRTALIQLVNRLQASHSVAPACTIVAGFSQGGILSASVGLSAPESVAGFAVLAGRILPELEPAIAASGRLAGLRALIAHGRNDDKLPVSWAERAHAWLGRLGVTHELKLYPGGHGLSGDMAGDFLTWLRSVLASPVVTDRLELHLDDEDTRLSGSFPGALSLRIAPGVEQVARALLARSGSLAHAMEAAIVAIEDELARVPRNLHHRSVASRSPRLGEIARAAGLDGQGSLSLDAVERVFSRQSAVAMGLPAASEGLPEGLAFIAGLLVTRELMHHLGIESITLAT
ncbi:alpha/beta hydrolase [Ralstonia solanacearum]|uniref:alpha/beta hydrolase n=1 Tax=Ralstonia solanacearum TaxID=305 RepID=UPI0018D19E81|nr:hypothetical protein [Ralstonia solanacearum]